MRDRSQVELSFEEAEWRALLLKKWSLYKQGENEMERKAIKSILEVQQEVLHELQLLSQELSVEAIKQDSSLLPFEREGPNYTHCSPTTKPLKAGIMTLSRCTHKWGPRGRATGSCLNLLLLTARTTRAQGCLSQN